MGITARSYATFISFQGLKVPRWKTSNWHNLSYEQNIRVFQEFFIEKHIKSFLSANKVIEKKILLLFPLPRQHSEEAHFSRSERKNNFQETSSPQ